MTELLICLVVIVLIVGGMLYLLIRRGLEFRELCLQGIETTAVVVEKRSVKPGGTGARQYKVVYRYMDAAGEAHEHTSVISIEQYERLTEGGDMEVVYSARRPQVSAPRYLVEAARQAVGKK